jgi:hypothetical protein
MIGTATIAASPSPRTCASNWWVIAGELT